MWKLFVVFLVIAPCCAQNVKSYTYCEAGGVTESVHTDGLTLAQVQLVFRHGDRTPADLLPGVGNDQEWDCTLNHLTLPSESTKPTEYINRIFRKMYLPKREDLPGNCMFGQLTSRGLHQHVELGSELRDLYILKYKFLSQELNTDELWVRSTDVPRTLDSAMAQLEGLYPSDARAGASVDVVQMYTMDNDEEDLWVNELLCPKLHAVEKEIYSSLNWTQEEAKYAKLKQQLLDIFNMTQLPDWGSVCDVLLARQCHGFPLPEGVTDDMAQQIWDIATWQLSYLWQSDAYVKLGMGFIVKEIFQRIEDVVANGVSSPKYFMYSAHDSSVGPLLGNLGIFDGKWPPYRSHVEIELWSGDGYFVQIKYNGQILQLPGCSDVMCAYNEFSNYVKTRIPNYPQDC